LIISLFFDLVLNTRPKSEGGSLNSMAAEFNRGGSLLLENQETFDNWRDQSESEETMLSS